MLRFTAIALLFPSVIAAAQPAPPARLPEAQAIQAATTEFPKECANHQLSGAVLVAKNANVLYQSVCGLADRENKIPNTVDTKFRFGSMGKMFTAVAILQMVEAGKIQLDAPLSKYLPDYPNKDVAAVTIHQLLTHTGGTGDIFSPEFFAHPNDFKTHADYVKAYGDRGPQFTPGSTWGYSNYGFILLGRIIEVVSGQSYSDYVRDHVFLPAGMRSTGNLPEDQHVPGLSVGYTTGQGSGLVLLGPPPGKGSAPGSAPMKALPPLGPPPDGKTPGTSAPLQSTSGMLPYSGTSAGGGYSTVGDLLAFVNALNSGKLLNAHSTELLTAGKVKTERPGMQYAYGFEDRLSPDGVRSYGHGGGAPGQNGRLSVFPQSGYVVIVLANLDPPAADNLARYIADRLPAY